MTRQIIIPAWEHGCVRVFSLNLSMAQVERLLSPAPPGTLTDPDTPPPAARLLGLAEIDAAHTEIFPVSDLEGLGLASYLVEGQGIARDQILPDFSRLNALDGYVMIVRSRAFGGAAATLATGPEITLIGSYQLPEGWSQGEDFLEALDPPRPLSSLPGTPGTTDTSETPAAPTRKPVSDAAMSGRVATVALLVLFALVALMVMLS